MLINGVSISSLPRTFRDAILVARNMGVRFLWIDSLCILQDSESDWLKESALMADIYRGSVCNIAATSSSNADQGCLYKNTPPTAQSCTVKPGWGNGEVEYLVYNKDYWEGIFENDPLRQRAWVVQELLLPHRILHLGRYQISWECYDKNSCEMYPYGIPSFIGVSKRTALESPLILSEDSKSVLNRQHYPWETIVKAYTSCNLTKPQDKLIALSGVAKILQSVSKDQYLAGLWRKDFITQLLWDASWEQLGPLVPSKEYRAPSWSWASIEGRVSMRSPKPKAVEPVRILPTIQSQGLKPLSDEEGDLIKVLDVSVQAASGDPTGLVTGGYLRVAGPLTTIEIEPPAGHRPRYHHRFDPDSTWGSTYNATRSSLEQPSHLHCLFIRKRLLSDGYNYDCLILLPTGEKKRQFRRWGYLLLVPADFKAFQRQRPSNWFEYEEEHDEYIDGKWNYVISIV